MPKATRCSARRRQEPRRETLRGCGLAAGAEYLIERYLLLGLELGQHVDGFVDAYYGPPELQQRVETGAPADPRRLVAEADSLAADLQANTFLNVQRKRWLLGQVLACGTVARRVAGDELSWTEEVERCLGVRPEPIAEGRFTRAHQLLDDALPGSGPLAGRYSQWLENQAVPRDLLVTAAERLCEPLRRRSRELSPMPEAEDFDLELVDGEPWSAFNYYLGDYRSRVVINADAPMWSSSLTDLVAHELYPGHHTEHVCKEALLARQGFLEETIVLVLTPQALVSEGVATLALEVALGKDAHSVAAGVLRPLGVPYDDATAAVIQDADEILAGVVVNVAYQLHEEGRSPAELRDYARHWSLKPDPIVERMLAFADDPVWRTYVTTYSDGLRLCREFVAGQEQQFTRLLTEQLTPGDLVSST